MRVKTLELLRLLDDEELTGTSGHPVYLNHRQVEIAKEVHQIITRDISERITNEELAETLNTSSTTIKTSFKGVFGVSIRAYMKQYRLHTAQKLLEETDMSISEVAASVGYTNPGKFTVTFRETFGATPGGYRKAARAKL